MSGSRHYFFRDTYEKVCPNYICHPIMHTKKILFIDANSFPSSLQGSLLRIFSNFVKNYFVFGLKKIYIYIYLKRMNKTLFVTIVNNLFLTCSLEFVMHIRIIQFMPYKETPVFNFYIVNIVLLLSHIILLFFLPLHFLLFSSFVLLFSYCHIFILFFFCQR